MSESRDQILETIRRAVRGDAETPIEAPVFARQQPGLDDSIKLSGEEAIEHFTKTAKAAFASVQRLSNRQAVPAAVLGYLQAQGLTAEIHLSPGNELSGLDWGTLQLCADAIRAEMSASLGVATAGVLESGSIVMCSSAEAPTTLNYLPDHHLVLLPCERLLGTKEDVFAAILREGGLPRTVNFITGPSRTADIEQVIQLGAHGPRNLHIMLIDEW